MKLLLTNDDGIDSEGILALARRLSEKHEVLIVAPFENQSARSHAITLRTRQRVEKRANGYAMEGLPVDCVQFALFGLHYKPDLLLSGINNGMNLGSDVLYSGTVGAAMEGTFLGVPSIALSLFYDYDLSLKPEFSRAAEYVAAHLERWKGLLRDGVTLNVNLPLGAWKGERVCPLGRCEYDQIYQKDGEGYRLEGMPTNLASCKEGSDFWYAYRGYITLTPLRVDWTDSECIKAWKQEGLL